ncbi:Hypothetical protein D9617_12g036580 [Elsinoe fawcettii]|nr:Hypothetical protein D9617_12g036580 [Elsinoe fawcettii]
MATRGFEIALNPEENDSPAPRPALLHSSATSQEASKVSATDDSTATFSADDVPVARKAKDDRDRRTVIMDKIDKLHDSTREWVECQEAEMETARDHDAESEDENEKGKARNEAPGH